jgi:hypothetical protein
MAPQQPAQQADFSTILPILALAMNRKGGGNSGDLSNIFNELMGVMSNSYTAPSQMSDEEIMSVYAPQTISLQNTNDPILQGILADIQSGTPALKIKEAIRQGITNGSIKPTGGPNDLSLYDGLVDELFAEKKQVDQKRYEVQNKQTIYEQYGLPDPSEQFDATQLFPEVFTPMFDRLASTQKDVDKRMKDIDVAAGDPNVYIQPKVKTTGGKAKSELVKQGTSYSLGNLPGLLARNIVKGVRNFKDQSDMSLEEQYQSDLNVTASSSGLSPQQVLTGTSPQAQAARRKYQIMRQNTLEDYEKKQQKEAPKLDARATAMNKAAIAYQKELAGGAAPQRTATLNVSGLKDPNTGKDVDMSRAVQGSVTKIPTENLRDPVLQQQKLMNLVAQKVQEGLAARGETPFNQALLNRIIVNQSMGK